MATVPLTPDSAPQPPTLEGGAPSDSLAAPTEPLKAPLTEEQQRSVIQLKDILGMESDRPLAAVIPFPAGADDMGLGETKTVEEAVPLIGRMLKAEREAGGTRKVYPRALLRQQHIVAYMLCNPFATTTEICAFFGISPTTLNNISKSDTFKSLILAHRVTLDSGIGADLQAQLRDTMAAAVEVVQKAVVEKQDPDYALEVMDKTANRMGMGAKHQSGGQVTVNIITPEMIAAARAARERLLPDAS